MKDKELKMKKEIIESIAEYIEYCTVEDLGYNLQQLMDDSIKHRDYQINHIGVDFLELIEQREYFHIAVNDVFLQLLDNCKDIRLYGDCNFEEYDMDYFNIKEKLEENNIKYVEATFGYDYIKIYSIGVNPTGGFFGDYQLTVLLKSFKEYNGRYNYVNKPKTYSSSIQSMIDTRSAIQSTVYEQNGYATPRQESAIDTITRKLQQIGIE